MNESHSPIPCNFGFITLPKLVDPQYGAFIMQEMQFMSIFSLILCHNPSLGLATKAKGVARLRAKRKSGSHNTYS
jgi:hypothetical protein